MTTPTDPVGVNGDPGVVDRRVHRRDSSFRLRVCVAVLWCLGLVAILTVVPVDLADWSPWGESTAGVTKALVAGGLAVAGLAMGWAAWNRASRSRIPQVRRFRLLAVSAALLYLGQSVANLLMLNRIGPYEPLTDAVPLVLFGGFAVAAITALTWPTGMEPTEKRAVFVDGSIGALGLAIVWVTLVIPAHSLVGAPWERMVVVAGGAIEFSASVLVLILAAGARRRAAVPIVQVVLLQLAIVTYVGFDILAETVPFGDRVTDVTLSSVGFVLSAGFVVLAALRRADEHESARQLWLRDMWSSVIPLSPIPVAAGVLLVALVTGRNAGAAAAVAVALMLLVVICAVLWLRLAARAELRRASVTMATATFTQATDQPWFQALIQNSRDIVIVVDRRNRVVYASPSLCSHVGSTLTELQGRLLTEVVPQLTTSAVRSAQRFPDRPALPLEVALTDHAGAEHNVQFHVSSLVGLGVEGFVLTGQDVTDTRRMRVLLGESRRRDRLTGLMNSEAFGAAVDEAQTWSDPRSLAVTVFDVCDLRGLVDARGRAAGDAILVAVAEALEQASGPILAVARLNADAFAALLRDPAPDIAVAALTDRLRVRLGSAVIPGGAAIKVRLAVGYTTAFSDTERATDLVEQADLAASHSLSSPNLPVVRFEHAMRESLRHEWEQRAGIADALEAGEFVPFYQPIVSLADGSVVALEALARRRLPDGSLQQPSEFIPVAERVGQVAHIDAAIRSKALADLRTLNRQWPNLGLSLNITPADFNRDFADGLLAEVATAGVSPGLVTFEFTESTVAESAELAAAVLADLHAHGFGVALDDFGTGFSSLSGLGGLDVDILKIDQVFVAELASSARAVALMRAVIEVGRGLRIITVAEGVRSVEQADLLRGMGCDRVQGYLHAEALPLPELVEWLQERGPRPVTSRR